MYVTTTYKTIKINKKKVYNPFNKYKSNLKKPDANNNTALYTYA
jgi:hypothetical protein